MFPLALRTPDVHLTNMRTFVREDDGLPAGVAHWCRVPSSLALSIMAETL